MAKRRKRPLRGKYIIRRFMLTAVILGLFAAGGWFAYTKFFVPKAEPVQASVPEPVPSSSEEASSEPEPVSASEPEPESVPETEPRSTAATAGDWELLLVNPSNYLPENYKIELEAITDSYSVDRRIADSVKRMFAQAKQDGISLIICSAYRSVEKQQSLFSQKEQEFIAQGQDEQQAIAAAATIIAKPGSSEHHTGLAIDIITSSYTVLDSGFANTPAFKWLNENAQKYGFVMRYPSDKQDITKIIYEPWHYRYVGEENARIMNEKGLCLEEYVDSLRQTDSKIPEIPPEEPEASDIEAEPAA